MNNFYKHPVKRTAIAAAFICAITLCGFTTLAQSYCMTDLSYYGCAYGGAIDNFSLSTINQTGTGCTGGTGVADYTSEICVLAQGEPYMLNYTSNSGWSAYNDHLAIWIDFNNDFDFDDNGEFVFHTTVSGIHTTQLTVSASAPTGNYRMRVRCINSGTALTASQSCYDNAVYYSSGEIHDYTATITAPPSCPSVSNVSISNIGLTTADLNWTCNGCSEPFIIEFGLNGFTPGTNVSPGIGGSIVNAAGMPSLPVTLTGLTSSTDYDVYVRRNCGANGFSANNGPISFITLYDVCATLTPVTCGIPVTATIPSGKGAFDTTNCGLNSGKELLYEFTPSQTGIYTLTILNTNYNYVSYMIKAASAGCVESGWNCAQALPWNTNFSSPETIILDTLQAGTTYYLCVDATYAQYGAEHTFQIDCYQLYNPCPGAISITCGVPVQGTISSGLGAFTNYNSNSFNFGKELLYKFTPLVTGIYTLKVNSTNGYYSADYLYKKTSEGCNSTGWHLITGISSVYQPVYAQIGSLIGGTEYYLMMDAIGMAGTDQNFQIECLTSTDPCSAIQPIACNTAVTVSISPGAGVFGSNSCSSVNHPLCIGKEAIFQFTPTVTGFATLHVLTSAGPDYNNEFHYFIKNASGGCNASGWTCLGRGYPYPGFYELPFELIAGQTYLIMVDGLTVSGNTQNFEITCPEPWDPCVAITSLTCGDTTTAVIPSGTGALNDPCTSQLVESLGKEFVYSFTPAITGSYAINVTATDYKYIKYLFKDAATSCNTPGWECLSATAWPTPSYALIYFPAPLISGHTYYLMLDAAEVTGAIHSFQLLCTTPVDPCANTASINCGTPTSFSNDSGLGIFDPVTYPGTNTFPNRETIFEFTPTVTGNHLLEIQSSTGYNSVGYFIKPASGGCNNNDWVYMGQYGYPYITGIPITLTAGVPYFLMADGYTEGQTFSITCPSASYDYCSTLSTISSCSVPVTVTIGPGPGAFGYFPGCSNIYNTLASPGKEQLFVFTPSVSGFYGLKVNSGTGTEVHYFVKPAADGCNNYNWECIEIISSYGGAVRMPFAFTAGTMYYILADAAGTTGATQEFELVCPSANPCNQITSIPDCGIIIEDTIPSGFNNLLLTEYGTGNPFPTTPTGNLKLYSITPTEEGIKSLSMGYQHTELQLFIKPASLGCDGNNWSSVYYDFGPSAYILPFNLVAGTTYYLLVANNYYQATSPYYIYVICPPECTQYADNDNDGYGNTNNYIFSCWPVYGYTYETGDCNDANPNIHTGVAEICGNNQDDDCDGQIDEGCSCGLTVNAGNDEATFFGYTADQTLTRTAVVSGGTPPYTYSWTMSRPLSCNQVNSNGDEIFMLGTCTNTACPTSGQLSNNPVCTGSASVKVKLMDTTEVCITVTDANGCIATDCFMVNATDARCFAGNSNIQKVKICHYTGNPNNPWVQICVAEDAVANLIAQGDYIGTCNAAREVVENPAAPVHTFELYPNPANQKVYLNFISENTSQFEFIISDIAGRIVVKYEANAVIGLNSLEVTLEEFTPGIYYIRYSQNNQQAFKKLVIEK